MSSVTGLRRHQRDKSTTAVSAADTAAARWAGGLRKPPSSDEIEVKILRQSRLATARHRERGSLGKVRA